VIGVIGVIGDAENQPRNGGLPGLVNVYITIENHHFEEVNQL
jgi:hypothetical protein